MSHTLFIADLHLSDAAPGLADAFVRFLQKTAPHADALYILGDLFEAWVGDDIMSDLEPQTVPRVMQALRYLTKDLKKPVYLMPGNRDFLLGKDFLTQTGIQLLKDPTVIDLYGTPTLLIHGDSLCTADKAYQRFRTVARNACLKKIFLALPKSLRRFIAMRLRAQSKKHTRALSPQQMDIVYSALYTLMQEQGITQIIHGHTHLPAIHYFYLNQQLCRRVVLSDWHEAKSHALFYNQKNNIFLKAS